MDSAEQFKPLVTVIVPAYNHEQYIEDCLCSIINQTYSNIQIIVINDGSKDNTENVIKNFIFKQSAKIEFISKENEGLCKTLNKGLEIAKGDYLAFLASDDIWLPNRIEKQVLFMERNKNIGMVFGDAYFINNGVATGKKYSDYKPIIKKYFLNSIQNSNIYETLLIENIIPALTVLIRKECFAKVGWYDTSLKYEDYDMWLRISKQYPIAYIDEPLAFYRIHDNNISNNVCFMLSGALQTIFKQYKDEPLRKKTVKKIFLFIKFVYTTLKNKINKYINYSR